MVTVVLQWVLCILAGFLLWRLWCVIGSESRFIRWVVGIGFVVRAFAGLALFWILYLDLPIARSFRSEGYWFFARDARLYFENVLIAVSGGLDATIFYTRTAPSVTFVQVLAIFGLLFGTVTSVALLLNLFCYLGSCAIILKWKNGTSDGYKPAAIAIVALSLSPSAALWSLQPLKDTLFQFLLIAFAAGGAMWQRGWAAQPRSRASKLVPGAVLMTATLFLVSGIRWYVGLTLVAAAGAFFLITALNAERKRIGAAIAAGIVMQILLTQAFAVSANPYVPDHLRKYLVPWSPEPQRPDLQLTGLGEHVEKARGDFERTGGATSIGVGNALEGLDRPEQPVKTAAVEGRPARREVPRKKEVSQPARPADTSSTTTSVAGTAPTLTSSTTTSVAETAPTLTSSTTTSKAETAPTLTSSTTTSKAETAPTTSVTVVTATTSEPPKRVSVPSSTAPSVPVPSTPVAPAPSASSPVPPDSDDPITLPTSRVVRVLAGASAVLVPSSVARAFGLIEMHGGRGLLWFTDVDTLIFDAMILIALAYVIRRWRWAWRNPLVWLVLILGSVGLPLLYIVTNFGTLFRLRMVIFVAAALTPLVVTMAGRAESVAEPEDGVAAAVPPRDE
jgi:hypothetical protein